MAVSCGQAKKYIQYGDYLFDQNTEKWKTAAKKSNKTNGYISIEKEEKNNLWLELFVCFNTDLCFYTVRHTEALSHHLMTRSISSFFIPMHSKFFWILKEKKKKSWYELYV